IVTKHVQPETAIVHMELVVKTPENVIGVLKTEIDHGIGFEGVI
ncbi:hypothetical protein A2U01_0108583, partial [Trifolium medium]|nr:hypothetical protein [Trifolium medium]